MRIRATKYGWLGWLYLLHMDGQQSHNSLQSPGNHRLVSEQRFMVLLRTSLCKFINNLQETVYKRGKTISGQIEQKSQLKKQNLITVLGSARNF
jgi:hypothetical protein